MIITHVFSACHNAITLHADHIGDQAQPIDVQLFNPHANAVHAAQTTIQSVLKTSRVETIAILYGTLSINTDSIADHIVSISNNKLLLQSVTSTNLSASITITQLCSNAQTTINNHAKKNNVA